MLAPRRLDGHVRCLNLSIERRSPIHAVARHRARCHVRSGHVRPAFVAPVKPGHSLYRVLDDES